MENFNVSEKEEETGSTENTLNKKLPDHDEVSYQKIMSVIKDNMRNQEFKNALEKNAPGIRRNTTQSTFATRRENYITNSEEDMTIG